MLFPDSLVRIPYMKWCACTAILSCMCHDDFIKTNCHLCGQAKDFGSLGCILTAILFLLF